MCLFHVIGQERCKTEIFLFHMIKYSIKESSNREFFEMTFCYSHSGHFRCFSSFSPFLQSVFNAAWIFFAWLVCWMISRPKRSDFFLLSHFWLCYDCFLPCFHVLNVIYWSFFIFMGEYPIHMKSYILNKQFTSFPLFWGIFYFLRLIFAVTAVISVLFRLPFVQKWS